MSYQCSISTTAVMGELETSLFVTHSTALKFPGYITVFSANPNTNQPNDACFAADILSCKWEWDATLWTLFMGHLALDGDHISLTTPHSDSVKNIN